MSAIDFNDPEMQEIFEGFLVETTELLDAISQDLVVIENNPDDNDLLNQLFRSFHTIKGTSSFMGFDSIATITHHAEDILNKLRRSELTINLPIIDVLLEVHDWIQLLIDNIKKGISEQVDYSATITEINRLKNPEATITSDEDVNDEMSAESDESELDEETLLSQLEEQAFAENSSMNEQYHQNFGEQNALLAVLNNHDLVTKPGDFTDEELQMIQAAFDQVNMDFQNTLKSNQEEIADKTQDLKTEEKEIKKETIDKAQQATKQVEKEKPKQSAQQEAAKKLGGKESTMKSATETIRIDVDRIESLMDLSGELVLGRNRLSQITNTFIKESKNKEKLRELIETTAQLDFITSEIQTAVMKMRMVPIAKLYQKAPRIVRDLSREFSKKINLVVKGEETEIDRSIIEELNDPLVHMIRNSCDHGIETTQEREAAGKPPVGTIILDAEQEGNAIVLRITDDGKGMDPEKLKEKALEKGVITEEQASQMSKREIFQLIFAPGFSTAAKVSNVSGRGVGMDVVRTNIQNLKGIIEIESEVGVGTTFIIKLPLTLAIIQGLLVRILDEIFAIPLSAVIEVVSIDIKNIYSVKNQEVMRIRDDVNPLIRLDKVLMLKDPNETLEHRYVVIVGVGLHRVGLVVDELLGQQEIVIKSLGEYLGHIPGIAGSTIMGNGSVIMIIDVVELVRETYHRDFN